MRHLFPIIGMLLMLGGSLRADLPFPIGETLKYTASWNGIPVAWATSTTELDRIEDGREVLAIRVRAQTYSFFNHIFKVDDSHESLVDPETFLPIRYTKNLAEGRYRCHEITTFDFDTLKAHYEHQTNGTRKEYDIEEDTRDILSFMYFMRSALLAPELETGYRVMSDEKIYEMILNTYEVDEIDLPEYKEDVSSLKIVPEAKFDGLFVRKGKATVWVSRDPRRLMTFMKVKVPFGRIRITLNEVSGPGDDFWITDKKTDDDDGE